MGEPLRGDCLSLHKVGALITSEKMLAKVEKAVWSLAWKKCVCVCGVYGVYGACTRMCVCVLLTLLVPWAAAAMPLESLEIPVFKSKAS